MTPLAFLDGIGFSEMIVIAFISILVFGGRLPDVLRNLGRTYAKFRKGLHDLSAPIRDEIQRATNLPEGTSVDLATLPEGQAAPPGDVSPAPASAGYEVGTSPPAATPTPPPPEPTPGPGSPNDDLAEPPLV